MQVLHLKFSHPTVILYCYDEVSDFHSENRMSFVPTHTHLLSAAITFDYFVVRCRCECRRLCYVIIRLLSKCTWFWRNCGWTWEFGSSGFHGIMLRRFSKENKKHGLYFILRFSTLFLIQFLFGWICSIVGGRAAARELRRILLPTTKPFSWSIA